MAIANPVYRDIYIDKGADYNEVIEISVPFEEYNFVGTIKSSYLATTSIAFTFSAVENEPKKVKLFVSSDNTQLLRRRRGVYDIFATHKITGAIHKEREGTAHYANSATIDAPVPPPAGYQITLSDIIDAGTAAAASLDDLATAEQGELADTALQPDDIGVTVAAFSHTHDPNPNAVLVDSPTEGAMIQRIGSSWLSRTIDQIKTALGLGSAAYTSSGDYDASGSANTAQSFAIQRGNHTGTQAHTTITGLGNAATASTSWGGNHAQDSGKVMLFGAFGDVQATESIMIKAIDSPFFSIQNSYELTENRYYGSPDASGFLAITSNATGQVQWLELGGVPLTFAPIIGNGSDQAVAGNDARLTDARTPTAHTHDIYSGLTRVAPSGAAAGSLASNIDGTGQTARNALGAGSIDLQSVRTDPTHVASGNSSFAFGQSNTASGLVSFAGGISNAVSGDLSTAFGSANIVSGDASFAFGLFDEASGDFSFAGGSYSEAQGEHSFAFGFDNTASGSKSWANGEDCAATASYSHASGLRAKANHTGSRVISDSQNSDVASTNTNQLTARFENGYSFLGGAANFDTLPTVNTVGLVLTSDARLTNSRTPTAHKSSHAIGGVDVLSPSDIGAIPTTDKSTGGNGAADSGKVATYSPEGYLTATDRIYCKGSNLSYFLFSSQAAAYVWVTPQASGSLALTDNTSGIPDKILPPSAKTTPVDADTAIINDSAASGVTKTLTFANLWVWIKSKIESVALVLLVKGYTESVVSIGTVTTSHTLVLTNGTRQRCRLTASTACTFAMPTATDGKSFVLEVEQAVTTGLGTAVFTGVDFGAAGTQPVTPTAGKMDIYTFMANGSKWFGSCAPGYTY